MFIAIFFVLGLFWGSFINVVVFRLKKGEDFISGRSRCPKCKKTIRWFDNIPLLSFVILRGRCRNCRKKISPRYPLVEILTAAAFSLIGGFFFDPQDSLSWILTAYYLLAGASFIALAVYDWLYLEIPMEIICFLVWVSVACGLYLDAATHFVFLSEAISQSEDILEGRIFSGVLAGFFASLFFFSLSWISKEKWMGAGDGFLGGAAGLFLGWPLILPAVFFSFLIGAVYGVFALMLGGKTLKSQIPFAPFLVAGIFISLFWGREILGYYFSFFNQ